MAAVAGAEEAEGRALLEALWAAGSDEDEHRGDGTLLNVQSQSLATNGKLATYREASAVVPPVTLLRKSAMLSPLPIRAKVTDPMAVQHKVREVQSALETRGQAFKAARLEASKCAELIRTMEDSIKSLQEEEQQLLGKFPPPATRLQRVRQWLSERHAELAAQRVVLEGKQLALLQAESQLRAQETEADLLADAAAALEVAVAADTAAAAAAAAEMREREVAGAMGYVRSIDKAQQQVAQRAAQEAAAAEEKIRAAQEAQSKARQRLKAATSNINSSIKTGQALVAQEHEAKAAALMALKGNISASQKRIAKNADLFGHLQKQKREMEAREFEALQEQGLNPYEVYRRRDNDKELEQQRLALEAGQQLRLAKTTAMLAAEERAAAKAAAKREADRAYEEKYQKEMGVAVQQKRTDAYMRTHTISGEPILDPTSRLKPHPSQAMLVKPKRFGLGGSPQAAIDMVAARHPTSDLSGSLLLPSRYREGAAAATAGAGVVSSSSGGRDDREQQEREEEEDREPASPSSPPADDSSSGRGGSNGRAGSSNGSSGRDKEGAGKLPGSGSSGRRARSSTMDDGGDSGGADAWGQPKGRVLSKFERDKMAAAHARHKASIAQPKASMGRTFGGDAYICSPQVVEFKDFVPGRTYTCKVSLINRSYTKNTIRLEELPAKAIGQLAADMAPPGGMAPGTACELLIAFTARADTDLITHIPLLSNTGPLSLPVHCLCRKAVLSISPHPAAEVGGSGGVLVADKATQVITISNDGALEVVYDIKIEGPLGDVAEITERPLAPGSAELMCSAAVAGFTLRGTKGRLGGYAKATFTAEFAPTVPGCVELPLQLRFSAPANRALAIPSQRLTVVAWGRELPVFAERPLLDFKCCIAGRGYKDVLLLHNASRAAMKVAVVKRADVAEWLEFLPDMGFIQAGDTFPISVAFKPSMDMLQRLHHLVTDPETATLEIPLKVSVLGQPLPVDFTVRARLTTSDLSITPSTLDFGRCLTCEKKGLVVRMHNGSALPQAVSFGVLPQGLSLSPNDGFARLLPDETIELVASFQPPIPGPQFFSLTATSLYGRRITLEGKALGIMPTASLSYNQVKLPATTINDTTAISLSLRNHSEVEQAFEFGVPQGSHLSLAPRVGTLPPKGTVRLQLEFAPPEALLTEQEQGQQGQGQQDQQQGQRQGQQQQQQQQQAQSSGAVDAGRPAAIEEGSSECGQSEQQQGQDEDTWHVWRKWLLPCYVRPKASVQDPASTSTTATAASSSSSTSSAPGHLHVGTHAADGADAAVSGHEAESGQQVLHCEVVTCAVRQELVLDPPLPKPHGGRKPAVLDFGAVPVGERVTQAITIRNDSLDEVDIDAEPLDPAATFSLVNALRPLAPRNQGNNSTIRILLAFQPPTRSNAFETLTIRTARSKLRINLKGVGIAPEIKISPEEAVAKGLDLGDVLAGEQREARLTVTNACPFAVTFTTRFLGPAPSSSSSSSSSSGSGGKGGGPARPGSAVARAAAAAAAAAAPQGVFFCRSSEGSLNPGDSQEVVVVFAPPAGGGLATPYASDRLQVLVPNQAEELVVGLRGRVWSEGAFLAGLQYLPVPSDAFANAQRAFAMAVAPAPAAAAPAGKGQAPQQTQQQQGQQQQQSGQQRELTLTLPGSIAPGQSATATFEVGSLKSALGGGPVELTLEELPSSCKEAGWTLDPVKVTAAAGELKPVTVRFVAPAQPPNGSVLALGLPEWAELCVGGTLKGGVPAVGGPEGRRVALRFRCLMTPATGSSSTSGGSVGSSKGGGSTAAAPAAGKPR